MKHTLEFLSDEELDWLDDFLLGRFDGKEEDLDADEGVIVVSELDGFFTAIVSGPVMIPPSEWMPAVWGDFPPDWNNIDEVKTALSLMMQHMNNIATTLMTQPDHFEALFQQRKTENKIYTIVDECEGYMRGVAMASADWDLNKPGMNILLGPMRAFSGDAALQTHESFNEVEIENIQKAITPNAREIHAYWLARRHEIATHSPVRRSEPRVGRNEPCPCGSGKKYKKCCLH